VIVPHRRVPWRHAAVGGFVGAVLFEAAKELFAYYVRYAPTYNLLYGTFAAVPFFLLWMYISWSVVLLGAELTACLGYWAGRSWRHERTAGARFRAAISLVRLLMASEPKAMPVKDLRRVTSLPVQEIEDTLAHLADAGIARREGRAGYALARAPGKVSFGDLYRAAVGPIGGMSPQDWADVSPEFERAAAQMEQGLARPIATLAASAPPAGALRKARRGRARSGRSSR
jgi:membrane protein